jgi:hypothetical protein
MTGFEFVPHAQRGNLTEIDVRPAQLLPAAAERHAGWAAVKGAAGRLSPVLWPSAVLGAARWWHGQGAAHSAPDMVVPGLIAAGSFAVGTICAMNGDRLTKGAAIAYSLSGAAVSGAVVAYAGGMALPTLLWTLASGVAVKLADLARAAEARHRRRLAEEEASKQAEALRRAREAEQRHGQRMEREQLRSRTTVTVKALDVFAAVAVAELDASARVAEAELKAGTAHAALPGVDRPALPEQRGRRELADFLRADDPQFQDAAWLELPAQ